jgi:hypothetical protein
LTARRADRYTPVAQPAFHEENGSSMTASVGRVGREAHASSSAARRLLPWVLLLSAALNAYQIWWGLPLCRPIARESSHAARPEGSGSKKQAADREAVVAWGTDEVAPMGPLVYAKRTFVDGSWSHKYPAFHFMLLNAAYAPVFAYLLLSGRLSLAHFSDTWPYGFSDPTSSLTILVLIARVVSALMGTAVVGLLYVITERLFEAASGLFAALIVAVCFPFVYYSHTSNLDVPYLFWFTLGCVFYLRLFENGRTRDYLLLAVCMALAVATKDQAYALLPFLPIALILGRLRQERARGQHRATPLPWSQWGLAVLAFAATYVIAANVLNNWPGYLQHLRHIAGPGSADYQEFPNTLAGHLALLSRTISLLAQSLNLPLFVVCVVGIVWSFRRFPGTTLAILAPAVSYYIFFLAVILYGYPRFLLPFVLVSAIFGGKLLGDLWAIRRPVSWMLRPAIVLLLAYSTYRGASVDWLLREDPRYAAEQWLRSHVPATAVIEAYGPSQYLPRLPGHPRAQGLNLEGYVEDAFRERAPDYVVLAHAYYKRITEDKADDFDQEEFLDHLWHGELGYRTVADFTADGFGAPNLIPGLNSRIVIFERTERAR